MDRQHRLKPCGLTLDLYRARKAGLKILAPAMTISCFKAPCERRFHLHGGIRRRSPTAPFNLVREKGSLRFAERWRSLFSFPQLSHCVNGQQAHVDGASFGESKLRKLRSRLAPKPPQSFLKAMESVEHQGYWPHLIGLDPCLLHVLCRKHLDKKVFSFQSMALELQLHDAGFSFVFEHIQQPVTRLVSVDLVDIVSHPDLLASLATPSQPFRA